MFGKLVSNLWKLGRVLYGGCKIEILKKGKRMESIIELHVEKLPEGVYLATSSSVQGLVAQGRTLRFRGLSLRGERLPKRLKLLEMLQKD